YLFKQRGWVAIYPIHRGHKGELLGKRNFFVKSRRLRLHANNFLYFLWLGSNINAINYHLTAINGAQCFNHFKCGGFAGTIRAKDAEYLTLLYRKSDVVHDLFRAITFCKIGGFEDGFVS